MTPQANKQPRSLSFGLSCDDVQRIEGLSSLIESGQAGSKWLDLLLPKSNSLLGEIAGALLLWGILWPFFLVGLLVTPLVNVALRIKLKRDPSYAAYLRFRAASVAFERTQRQYWQELSGLQFERNVARVFSQLGYDATVTRRSGDEGIDIVLRTGGQTAIVQCKRTSKRVSPAIARDLFGTLHACGATVAFLVCSGGFTAGTRTFCRNKPIRLLDLEDILDSEKFRKKVTSDFPAVAGAESADVEPRPRGPCSL